MTLPAAGELDLTTQAPAPPDASTEEAAAIQGRSLGAIAWRRLRKDTLAMIGGCIVIAFALIAILARPITQWYGQGPVLGHVNLTDPTTTMPLGSFGGISGTHWLGVTPVLGQDIFAQLVYGARTSLIISSLAVVLALVLGVSSGVAAGYFRGVSDSILSRLFDLILAFPQLLFAISLLTVFSLVPTFLGMSGQVLRFFVIIFVIGFFAFPYIGRIVRGQVLSLREKEFVDAAHNLGASNYRIMTRELLPNLLGPILVYATLSIPNFMLAEAGLAFLGVGVQPPTVSWGSMLSDAGQYFQVDPTYLFAPGLTIFIAVLAFNLLGDGLRDALDPKSSR